MMKKIKENYKVVVPAALIILAVISLIAYRQLGKNKVEVVNDGQPKIVKVVALKSLKDGSKLEVEGTVKAVTKVDLVALANGTVRSINFKVGDKVTMNQGLAFLSDETLATNYANSSLNYSNISQNVALTKNLTDEGIRQSGLGVERAKEILEQAQIGLDTAKQNLENAKSLQVKNKEDAKNNALIAYSNYLNTVNSALDQANYIIKADGSRQLDGISGTLSVMNSQVLINAKDKYLIAKDSYNKQVGKTYTTNEASLAIQAAVNLLNQTKVVIDLTISALDNTISSSQFSEASLTAQRNSFTSIRSGVVAALSAAQASYQALQNVDLINKRELDGLTSGVKSAENQLNQATIGYENAKLALGNSKQTQNQQVLLSKSSLDNARGQLNIIGTQLSDLYVKAPIAGQITAKSVEVGAEVRIGQKLGEISQTNMVKVVINLSPEDADLIKLGQKARVNDKISGTISNINPSADPLNKKVLVEVVIENKDKLIPETLAKVTFTATDNQQAKQQYKVPLTAITVAQNDSYIFIAGENTVKKVAIELLEIDGDWALVKVALPASVNIVIEGNKNLSDGDAIEIK